VYELVDGAGAAAAGALWTVPPSTLAGFAIFVRWIVRRITSVRTRGLSVAAGSGSELELPPFEAIAAPARPPSASSVTDTAPFTVTFSMGPTPLLDFRETRLVGQQSADA